VGESEIVITALGMATPLGLDAEVVGAAARAGLSRARDLDSFLVFDEKSNNMVPIKGHTVGHHTEGFGELGRLARLGSLALADLLHRAALDPNAVDRTGFFLAAPSGYLVAMADALVALNEDEAAPSVDYVDPFSAERRKAFETRLVGKIYDLCRLSPPRAPREVVLEDQAGFAMAAEKAIRAMQAGTLDRAIVGGVDSLLERETLEALAGLSLLKTPDNAFGTLPGEGAAFLLLERTKAADKRGKASLACMEMPAVVMEQDHQFSKMPPNGRALSQAVEQASHRLPSQGSGVGLLIGTHNGHPWTSMEWGRAQVRLPRALANARQWRPAESFGETGAAAGAITVCLGTLALARGYARTREVLAWMSSGRGGKGAVALRARGA